MPRVVWSTKNSSMPGLRTTTTWPRTGTTSGSGTRSRAPTPVQFTTTGASSDDAGDSRDRGGSDVTAETSTVPPAASYRASR